MITDYMSLCDSIADELNRTDLMRKIPEWVSLAEKWIAREIRLRDGQQLLTGTLVIDQEYIDLPTGFKTPIHIEIQSSPLRTLSIVSWDKRSDVLVNDTSTLPRAIAFLGRRGYLAPVPQVADDYKLFYYGLPTPLSETNPTNDLIEMGPDVLKYAALMYSAPWIGEDERINTWKLFRDEGARSLKIEYWEADLYGATTRIRPEMMPRDSHK